HGLGHFLVDLGSRLAFSHYFSLRIPWALPPFRYWLGVAVSPTFDREGVEQRGQLPYRLRFGLSVLDGGVLADTLALEPSLCSPPRPCLMSHFHCPLCGSYSSPLLFIAAHRCRRAVRRRGASPTVQPSSTSSGE